MTIKFDANGNLSKDVVLQPVEFEKQFGYNPKRRQLIRNLFELAKTLKGFGCKEMYVDGSFITEKGLPNDVDVCFNVRNVDFEGLKQAHSGIFTHDGRKKIFDELGVHFFFISNDDDEVLEFFRVDKSDNKKGIVKMLLKEI